MKIRRIGQWLINWCWIVEVEDNGDGTCRVVSYDRTKSPGSFEEGRPVEDEARTIIAVKAGNEVLKVTNPKHVFQYKKEETGA
jgi:hypothetical protein